MFIMINVHLAKMLLLLCITHVFFDNVVNTDL